MILFRCWKCNRKHRKPETNVGSQFTCGGCENTLRVPRRENGNCRVRSTLDYLVEFVVCGGGGALLGFGLGVVIIPRWFYPGYDVVVYLIGGCTLLGFLAGVLGGTRGIDWIGDIIRNREQR